jgi:hypothetical protein
VYLITLWLRCANVKLGHSHSRQVHSNKVVNVTDCDASTGYIRAGVCSVCCCSTGAFGIVELAQIGTHGEHNSDAVASWTLMIKTKSTFRIVAVIVIVHERSPGAHNQHSYLMLVPLGCMSVSFCDYNYTTPIF